MKAEGGPTARSKIFKTPFLKDIEKSFQEVTSMGPEPHQFFLFKISQQIWLLEQSKVLAKMGRGCRLFELWPMFFCQICTDT